ncbi:dienelactone hydrolase family protein [Legionella worsleiensis]|uniref:Dienelactone hydrolase family transporter protein n=1 Tax=Legionella worsleiensis TaxID=45076 RepID=A0A0W1AFU4_9GAMM|nr:dienelactone hydrolase family protein [Legionella worsleiensis]KTD80019.1 dienelactone hydrolase family transporter protein [Legionella worsleiensis]STY32491.1 carboxymethylenebutenolidase [Legionella worsleiensis]
MFAANSIYHHNDQELHGFLAFDEQNLTPRPAVIVAHDWTGRNDFACQKARMLAEMGYVGFALDAYGQGRQGANNDEKMALMQPLIADRSLLRDRLLAAYHAVAARPEVDKSRIAVIGFCFGGLCALDLARSGADLKGVVTFHGILNKPEHLDSAPIKAKILVLHGYDDPMVKPEQVNVFCQEMTQAKVDWQVHMYGQVQHAFTNPQAHDTSLGLMFNSLAEQRSWLAMQHFLYEIFKQ